MSGGTHERLTGEFRAVRYYTEPSILNRRIPNGTYGGVRGRELITPSYSIKVIKYGNIPIKW
jgi:hypothetical protein